MQAGTARTVDLASALQEVGQDIPAGTLVVRAVDKDPHDQTTDRSHIDVFGALAHFNQNTPLELDVDKAVSPPAVVAKNPASIQSHYSMFQQTYENADTPPLHTGEYTITKVLRVPYNYQITDSSGDKQTVHANIFVLYNGVGQL